MASKFLFSADLQVLEMAFGKPNKQIQLQIADYT